MLRSVADPGDLTGVDECCLTCGQAADVFSWLALSRAVVRTQCGPTRPGGTGLGRALTRVRNFVERFMTLCEDMAGGMGGTRAVG